MKCFKSVYYNIDVPDGTLHIHIDYDEKTKKIESVFLNFPPLGTTISSLVSFLGIMISEYFKLGGDLDNILKNLYLVKGSKRVIISDDIHIDSITQAIALALKMFEKDIIKSESGG